MDQEKDTLLESSVDSGKHAESGQQHKKALSSRKASLDFKKYTKQIWLAGLGAFSRAEEEGNKLFDSLVKVGEELESSSQQSADHSALPNHKSNALANDKKEKVERKFDQGVHHSLNRIGLVSLKDIQHLESLIIQLHQKIDRLATENSHLHSELKKITKSNE